MNRQPVPRPDTHRFRRAVRNVAPPVGVIVLAVLAWAAISAMSGLPAFVLPSPAEVLSALTATWSFLAPSIVQTVLSTLLGLVIAVVLAVTVAAVMDFVPLIKRALYPVLVASQTVQVLAIAPLLVIWFGFGRVPTVIIVVLFTFFPMAIASVDGLAATEPDYVSLIRSMGGSRGFVWRTVRLPAALPAFFSGLKLSVTYSVVAATIGEWVGGTEGLGLYMLRSKNALQTDQVFVGVVVTTSISIGLFAVVSLAERLSLAWRYRGKGPEKWIEKGIY
jgi:ABC-type nitrate/sulfonate/bicarbonate transport system permease component